MIDRRKLLVSGVAAAATMSVPHHTFAEVDVNKPPADQGFFFPHEGDPHEKTFMQWPVSVDTYGRRELKRVQSAIARLARTIGQHEPVTMIAGAEHHKKVKRAVVGDIELLNIPTDDLWARDSGPVFLKNKKGQLGLAELNFNGWGEKQDHDNDAFIAETVAQKLKLPRFNAGLVGEGGGVEQDGEGTLLAHESSWVNDNRNPFSKAQIDTLLRESLAAKQVIWAPGLKGQDITDYHVDSLARFVEPGLVLMQLPRSRSTTDPFEQTAWETYDILKKAQDAKGRKFEIVVVHDPEKPRDLSPDFLSAYVNYYVCNGAVICAEFGDDRADNEAKSLLAKLHPGRVVEMVNIDAIARNGGGIHCATREMPRMG